MKANGVTVILMTIIVSVTVFSNERQRMDIAAPDHSDFESRVHCIGDTGTNFDRRHMRRGEVWPVSAEPGRTDDEYAALECAFHHQRG